MRRLNLVWMIYDDEDSAAPSSRVPASDEQALEPLLELIQTQPFVNAALYLTGARLHRLQKNSSLWPWFRQWVQQHRIEMVGGPWCPAILSALPEHDAVDQLNLTTRLIQSLADTAPTAVWLCAGVWDASLPKLLNQCGFSLTFLSDRQLRWGISAGTDAQGYWTIEKTGFLLRVLTIHENMSDAWNVGNGDRVLELAQPYLTRAISGCTISTPLSLLHRRSSSNLASISAALQAFELQEHVIGWKLPTSLVRGFEPSGRCHPPSSVPDLQAEWVQQQAGPRKTSTRAVQNQDASWSPQTLPVAWDLFLDRYPEANLLHKKMLFLSSRIQRIKSRLRERASLNEDIVAFSQKLAVAQKRLLQAQTHHAYWPFASGGLYDPAVRQSLQEALIEIRTLLDSIAFTSARWCSLDALDLDRDGRDELLISTPHLHLLASSSGGCLLDLSCKQSKTALFDFVGRRPERVHQWLELGVGKPKRHAKPAPATTAPPQHDPLLSIAKRIRTDRYVRRGFIDHFLGASASPENFYTSRYPEVGDFIDGQFELNRFLFDSKERRAILHFSRNGRLQLPNKTSASLLRLEKLYYLPESGGTLTLQLQLTNRYMNPLAFRYGIEIPWAHCFDTLVTQGKAGAIADPVTLPLHSPSFRSHSNIQRLTLTAPGRNLEVTVELSDPAHLWYFDAETVTQLTEPVIQHQGTVMLLWWDIALWGNENRQIELTLNTNLRSGSSIAVIDEQEET